MINTLNSHNTDNNYILIKKSSPPNDAKEVWHPKHARIFFFPEDNFGVGEFFLKKKKK